MAWPLTKRMSLRLVQFAALMTSLAANGADYYVNADAGSDSNSGLSPTSAWKTIQHAADVMNAGDTCHAAPGAYNERVRISRSGAADAPVTFSASGKGAVTNGFTVRGESIVRYVVVDGFEITIPRQAAWDAWDTGSGVSLIDTQHCQVRNNHIHHTLREGILVHTFGGEDTNGNGHNRIANNRIEYAGAYAGITLNGAGHVIEDNDISHTIQHPLYPARSTANQPDADGVKFSGKDHVLRRNSIHDITLKDTGNVDPHIDAFQTYGPAYNIVIECNAINLPNDKDASQAAMISQAIQPTRDLTFRYNVITAFRGLNVWGINDRTKKVVPIHGVTIVNNTFYGVKDYDIELHNCQGSVVKNNVMSATGRYLWTDSNPDVACNGVPGDLPLSPNDKRVTDPKYVDAAHRDFHLLAGSPLIDAGTDVGARSDFDGAPVPQGGKVDIGAFEKARVDGVD